MFPARRAILAGATALALAVVSAGCAAEGDSGDAVETRTFKADNGQIEIPKDPQRVVATGYAVPALIEADAPLVGISSWQRGEPLMSEADLATYNELKKIAGENASETNYEAIAEVKPDLIVLGVPAVVLGDIDVKRLEGLAPVVAIGPTIPSDWRENTRLQADAAGALGNFEATKKEYDEKAAALAEKYQDVVPNLKLGHVGAYGEVDQGTFQREFDGSWGTNAANDMGANYYGEVAEPGPGSASVAEKPSIEELPKAFGEADAITYSVGPDGEPSEAVQYVLNSELWKNLPAAKAGMTFPIRYTEAATYGQAMQTLDAIDEAFAPLLEQ